MNTIEAFEFVRKEQASSGRSKAAKDRAAERAWKIVAKATRNEAIMDRIARGLPPFDPDDTEPESEGPP